MSETEPQDATPAETPEAAPPSPNAGGGASGGGKATERRRKRIVGEVVSDKMDKTITVRLQRLEKHRQYGKFVRRNTTLKAHDESEQATIGDVVRIEETRPLSKSKRWRLIEVVRKSKRATVVGGLPADSESAGS